MLGWAPPALALILVAVLLVFRAADDDETTASATTACASPRIGVMVPVTGDAASIGIEQRNWASYAVTDHNAGSELDVRMIEGDTQLEAAQAATLGTRFASNQRILAVVGPAGSPEVLAVGSIFKERSLAFVGMSATRVSLTDGSFPTFFRVVPNDSVQAPTVASYIRDELRAKRIFVVDDQTAYGVPLGDAVQDQLRADGIRVERESVSRTQSDFSALVSKIDDDLDVVFLAWQVAARAQIFGQQMREQRKDAVIFGSDGLFAPGDFTIENAYVSAFAPDIRGVPSAAGLVRRYTQQHGEFGTFGPPTYVATQILLRAIATACEDGRASRAEVLDRVRESSVPTPIFGRTISFTPRGDVKGARFFVYQIRGGRYRLVE